MQSLDSCSGMFVVGKFELIKRQLWANAQPVEFRVNSSGLGLRRGLVLCSCTRHLISQFLSSPRITNGHLNNFLEIHVRWFSTPSSGSLTLFLDTSHYKNWDTLWRVMLL